MHLVCRLRDEFLRRRDHLHRQDLSGHRQSRTLFQLERFSGLEEAQNAIEKCAREKGADAVVFEGISRTVSEPTFTTTEDIEKSDDGSSTRTATTQRNVMVTNRLEATFIKFRR